MPGEEVDDDSSCSEDEEAQAAFKRNAKKSAHNASGGNSNLMGGGTFRTADKKENEDGETVVSIRRYDEYGNFMTRSERSRRDNLKHGESMSIRSSARSQELRNVQRRPTSARRIKFAEPVTTAEHEIENYTDEEVRKCFLQPENWNSIDMDVELTRKRWQNHLDGAIPFDFHSQSIRGLEPMLEIDAVREMQRKGDSPAALSILTPGQHRQKVLEEQNRQKFEDQWLDMDAMRKVSYDSSRHHADLAVSTAKEDHVFAVEAWEPPPPKQTGGGAAAIKNGRKQQQNGERKGRNPLKGLIRSLSKKKVKS